MMSDGSLYASREVPLINDQRFLKSIYKKKLIYKIRNNYFRLHHAVSVSWLYTVYFLG